MLQHEIKNRTVFIRDNLEILRGMNSDTVDLIYLDPPFNKKKVFTAPIGSQAEGVGFSDVFKEEDVKEEWLCDIEANKNLHNFLAWIKTIGHKSNYSYLCYMAIRLIEMQRILKDTGSLYLHCDPTMSHYLKIVLDCVFGNENFRNEIVWERSPIKGAKATSKQFGRNIDHILFYTKSKNHYAFNTLYKPYDLSSKYNKFIHKDKDNRIYSRDNPLGDYSKESIERFGREGKIYITKHGKKQLIRYLDEQKGLAVGSNWSDIKPMNQKSDERTGYPTQKPLALLDRIIRASTNEGDVVLDPFCGCGTTCVASEKLSRQWVGIDINDMAKKLVNNRLKTEQAVEGNYIPVRTDKKTKHLSRK